MEPDGIITFIKKQSLPMTDLNILDLGCGKYQFPLLLDDITPQKLVKYVGVDVDEEIHIWGFGQVISIGSSDYDIYSQIFNNVFAHKKLTREEFDNIFTIRKPMGLIDYLKKLEAGELNDGPFNVVVLSNILHLMSKEDVKYLFNTIKKHIQPLSVFFIEYFFQNVHTCYPNARNISEDETIFIKSHFDYIDDSYGKDYLDKEIFLGVIK